MTLLVVVIHGTGRNGDDYFCFMKESVSKYFGADLSSVYIFAPQYYISKLLTKSQNNNIYLFTPLSIESDRKSICSSCVYWDVNDGWKAGDQSTTDVLIHVFLNVN